MVKPSCREKEACQYPQKVEEGNITIVHVHKNCHGYPQKPAKQDGHKPYQVPLKLIHRYFITPRKRFVHFFVYSVDQPLVGCISVHQGERVLFELIYLLFKTLLLRVSFG